MTGRLLVTGVLLLAPIRLVAQQGYHIGPPPPWVKPLRADVTQPAPSGNVTYSYELLLVDRQERIGGTAGVERYRHTAYRVLDQAAVQQHSQIEIVFDPAYEQITLIGLAVIRQGQRIDQLKRARISAVKRESEMDYQIFDGSMSLVLVLEDVKPGDVIEYSYARRGNNPVFAGHYSGFVSLQETVPLRAASFRLITPHDLTLSIRPHGTALQPAVTTVGDQREYLWSVHSVPAQILDPDLPDWYDPSAGIQISDFDSWRHVAAWGDSVFTFPVTIPRALHDRIGSIKLGNASKAAQVLAALHYVQDDVRYLGVEIGVNSHRPYPPATVVQRGYGDCKDKVLLLITMLHDLGIPAWPALVSTSLGSHIRETNPSTAYFDHAIVVTEVDGHDYWLDPTALHQHGDLAAVTPWFGTALVLGRGSDSLTTIPAPPRAAGPLTDVAVSFELSDVGKPAAMRVETSYSGSAADDMRESIRNRSREELRKDYTDYYAESYPGIRSLQSPAITDDETANLLHSSERYSVDQFWHPSANQPATVGTFDPLELDKSIPSPASAGRTMPLAVSYPVHLRYTITASIAGGWTIRNRVDSIETPAVRFVRGVSTADTTLTLRYDYETLADHVDPAAASDHLERMSRIRRLLTFTVNAPDTTKRGTTWSDATEWNWPVLFAGLFATALAIFGVVQLRRRPPPAWPRGPEPGRAVTPADDFQGLGGWLILVGIGVSLTPLVQLAGLIKNASPYTVTAWARLTTPGGESYHPLWAPTLLIELMMNLMLVVFESYLVLLFFRRRRWFPALFVLLATVRVGYDWADAIVANAIPYIHDRGVNWTLHLRNLLVFSLWIWYMFRSRRVQRTFVT